MLKKIHLELLDYLHTAVLVSSTTMASHLHISKRSVINYVKEINDEYPGLIQSTNKGYCLKPQVYSEFQKLYSGKLQIEPNRIAFIIEKLLSGYHDRVNIYQLSETLQYSDSTIRADLYKIQKLARNYHLDIQFSGTVATLSGPELRKRDFYFLLFQDVLEQNIYDFNQLFLLFPQIDSTRIYSQLMECIRINGCQISEYELVNVLYRLVICVERVFHGHIIDQKLYLRFLRNETRRIAQDLAKIIQACTGVTLPEVEVQYLAVLLAAMDLRTGSKEEITPERLKENLWPECYRLVNEILEGFQSIYQMDLRKYPKAHVDFALHVRSQIRRTHADLRIKNPYRKAIKRNNISPYDCAVYASSRIQKHFRLEISEDDIAYLALSLGDAFEKEFDSSVRLKVLFVLPSYYNVHNSLYNSYVQQFSPMISAVQCSDISTYKDLENIDIVVSTLWLKELDRKPFVNISPIYSMQDTHLIFQAINTVRHKKMLQNMRQLLEQILDDSRFIRSSDPLTQEQALGLLASPLKQMGIISKDFIPAVRHWETLSATVAGDILAFAHTPECPASADTLSVLISENEISWFGSTVRVVFLSTSIDGHYASHCLKVLRRVFHVINSSRGISQKLLRCRSCQDLIDLMA